MKHFKMATQNIAECIGAIGWLFLEDENDLVLHCTLPVLRFYVSLIVPYWGYFVSSYDEGKSFSNNPQNVFMVCSVRRNLRFGTPRNKLEIEVGVFLNFKISLQTNLTGQIIFKNTLRSAYFFTTQFQVSFIWS